MRWKSSVYSTLLMQLVKINIEIPEEVLSNMGKERKEFEAETKLWLATKLFLDKEVSLGKAAMVAGLARLDFMKYLQEQKIDIYRYEEGELNKEFEKIKKAVKK